MAALDDFLRTYATWDLNQRINWERFVRGGAVDVAAEERVITDWAKTNMGALGVYFNHPEIRPILLQAAREGWNDQRLNLAVTNTTFFKTHTENQRLWGILQATDPAEAAAQLEKTVLAVRTSLSQTGGNLTEAQIRELATTLRRDGGEGVIQNPVAIQAAAMALIEYNPTDQLYGTLGKTITSVKAAAQAYLIPVSDSGAFEYAKSIARGQTSEATVTESFKAQAKASYAQFADQLDQGVTMKDISDPYRNQAAQLLEINPETIDMTQTKYNQMLSFSGEKGIRAMDFGEAAKYIKSQDEYRFTNGANKEAASLATMIGERFGAI